MNKRENKGGGVPSQVDLLLVRPTAVIDSLSVLLLLMQEHVPACGRFPFRNCTLVVYTRGSTVCSVYCNKQGIGSVRASNYSIARDYDI